MRDPQRTNWFGLGAIAKPQDLVDPDDSNEIVAEGEEHFEDLAVEWSLKLDCSEIMKALSSVSTRPSEVVYFVSERLIQRVSEAVYVSLAEFVDWDAVNHHQREVED